MHKKLFIPGPVEVRDDVLAKMATAQIGHRTKEASALQRSISNKMKQVMFTKNEILLSTSSGSGLMEGAIRSCTRKRAACFSVGAFGDRWYQMAVSNGVPADLFKSDLGKATTKEMVIEALTSGKYDLVTVTHNETSTGIMNPVAEIAEALKAFPEVVFCLDTVSSMGGVKIDVDALGVDICITSTQKCLGLPAGMAICSISEKALNVAKEVPHRGMYFDLLALYDYIQKKDYQYPSTPSLAHMFALDYQLDLILSEGLEKRYRRHAAMARITRDWAKTYFKMFVPEEIASQTLTTVENVRGVHVGELNQKLAKRGYMISNGYGDLKEKTFRIAHMADTEPQELQALLSEINTILGL